MQLKLKNWILTNAETGEQVKANVPGDITKDLYDAGKIADPYFALNHHDCYNLCKNDYVYTTEFDLPEKVDLDKNNLYITFYGVDLFADVYLNGVLLGKTDNMFKEFKYEISKTAKEKGNVLEVKMYSTITVMENMDTEGYFGVFNTPRVLLRKEQCCFGWDWAANIPGYGIWKDVVVTAEPKERIEEVRYVAGMDKKAIFVAEVNYCYRSYFNNDGDWIEVINPYVDELRFTLSGKPGDEFVDAQVKSVPVKGRKHFVTFDMPNAELWWPNGYGEQPLYLYKIELVRDGEVISTKEGYMAFRSVELVEEALADTLLGYQIRLNGENIFVKGSNWVPVDCFTGAIENEKYVKLITQAKEANYNMLRVWGGGIYEHDVFYETCDKLGIMVWQDFMFACADIPDDKESWVKNTREECAYQIKRLRNHPSIVYWCGGNEKTGTFGSLIKYGDEFVDVILRGMIDHLDGTRPYARQSPCSWTDVGNDKSSGETHFSSFGTAVVKGVMNYRNFINQEIVPFASENASMGPVTKEAYDRFFPADKQWPMNDMWTDRMLMNPYAAEEERIPFGEAQRKFVTEAYGAPANLEEFISKGMTLHAELIRAEIEYQRSLKGFTSGFMNWMYSDMWPTATWAVVDYYTEPKHAYYQMKRSYAPVVMSFTLNKAGEVLLVGLNDKREAVKVKYEFGLKTLKGKTVWKKKGHCAICPNKAFSLKVEDEIVNENAYLYVRYTVNGETKTSVFSLNFWKGCDFASDYTVSAEANGCTATIKIKANSFAKSVFFAFPDNYKYTYSDNYLDVEAGEEKVVCVTADQPIDITKLTVTDFAKAGK